MDELVASLLSGLHQLLRLSIPPGEWPWAVSLLGAVIGLVPVFGAMATALLRHGIGNKYSVITTTVLAVFGILTTLVLPLAAFNSADRVLSRAATGTGTGGLGGAEIASLRKPVAFDYGSQIDYLSRSGAGSVSKVVFEGGGAAFFGTVSRVLLIGLPVLVFGAIVLQGFMAFRRGPKWPAWLFFRLPFVVLVVTSANNSATMTGHLWVGFLVTSLLGVLAVLVLGAPRWSVITKAAAEPKPPAASPPPQPEAMKYLALAKAQQQPPPQPESMKYPPPAPSQHQPAPVAARSAAPPTPTRIDPMVRLIEDQPATRDQLPPRDGPGQLASSPGPLPFGFSGSGPVPPPLAGGRPPAALVAALGSGAAGWNPAGGRFRRIRKLGQGGFGHVWLAMDTSLSRTVAVKIAHAADSETEERMLREARALAAVKHPNCVRVYDIIEEADGLAIVMEYIEGCSLSEAVRGNGLLDDVSAARLWVTMAGALSEAHGKGVLHRDVKPANVMIDEAGAAHLCDFGIARSRGDVTLTATGMMVGTPDYLAPEVAAGGSASPASDAWQLAATVSYALTGHPPRGEYENPVSALMAAAKGAPSVRLPQYSAHHRLLTAALGPDPARRPPLAVIARELGNWLGRTGLSQDGPVATMVFKRPEPGTEPVIDRAEPEPTRASLDPPTTLTADQPSGPKPDERTKLTDADRTQLTDVDRTKLTGDDRTQLTGADQTRLTGADQTQVTRVDQTQLAGPDRTQFTGPDRTQVTGADQTRLTRVDQTQVTGPDKTQVTGADQTQLTGADQTQLTRVDQTQLARPDKTQLTGPDERTRMTGGEPTQRHPGAR